MTDDGLKTNHSQKIKQKGRVHISIMGMIICDFLQLFPGFCLPANYPFVPINIKAKIN